MVDHLHQITIEVGRHRPGGLDQILLSQLPQGGPQGTSRIVAVLPPAPFLTSILLSQAYQKLKETIAKVEEQQSLLSQERV